MPQKVYQVVCSFRTFVVDLTNCDGPGPSSENSNSKLLDELLNGEIFYLPGGKDRHREIEAAL